MAKKKTTEIDLGITETPAELSAQVVESATTQQLEACLTQFGLVGMTAQEFVQVGVEEMNRSLVHAIKAGMAFWAAQVAVSSDAENGVRTSALDNFKDWIEQRGLTKERVYEAIRLAKFYAKLPDTKRAEVFKLGKSKALLLAGLSQEVIDQAAEQGQDLLEEADLLTVAELKERLKEAQRREANLNKEIERKDMALERIASKGRLTTFHPHTEAVRHECLALQHESELALNSLHKLFEEINNTDTSAPEWRLQLEHVWIACHAAAAAAGDLLARVKDAVRADDMPERVMGQHLLTAEEAEQWLMDAQSMLNKHEAAKATRATQRASEMPKGRGRPAKSAKAGE